MVSPGNAMAMARQWALVRRQWRGGVEFPGLGLSSGYPVLPTDVGPASSHHTGLNDAAYEMRDEMGCGEGLCSRLLP